MTKKIKFTYIVIFIILIITIVLIITKVYNAAISVECLGSGGCYPLYNSITDINGKKTCTPICTIYPSNIGTITSCQKDKMIEYFKSTNTILYSEKSCSVAITSCIPNWRCDGFNSCRSSKDGMQRRTCRDLNGCGNDINKPETVRSCTPSTSSVTSTTTINSVNNSNYTLKKCRSTQ